MCFDRDPTFLPLEEFLQMKPPTIVCGRAAFNGSPAENFLETI